MENLEKGYSEEQLWMPDEDVMLVSVLIISTVGCCWGTMWREEDFSAMHSFPGHEIPIESSRWVLKAS